METGVRTDGQVGRQPNQPQLSILLVEDEDSDAELILAELESAGVAVRVRRAVSATQFREALADEGEFDAILCDYQLPDLDALAALAQRDAAGLTIPLIVVSGRLTDERATECMRMGAADYVIKDRLRRLPHALSQAVRHERAERAGREAERRFERLFNDLPVAVFGATVEGQILHANPAMIAMFGFPRLEDLLATPLSDLHVEPNDRAALLKRLEADGHVLGFECRMRRRDGSEFWLSRDVHAVRQQDGGISALESIGRDISKDKEAAGALEASEEVFRALFDQSSVGIALLDVPRNGDQGSSRWNQRIRTMMGVDAIDYQSWVSLFDDTTGSELLEKYTRLLTGELDQIRERRRLTRPDGTAVWMDLSTIVVRDAEGDPVRWQTLALDITDQVEAEELLASRAARESVLLEITRAGLDGQPTAEFLASAIEMVVRGTDTKFGTILQMLPDGRHVERVAAHGPTGSIALGSAPVDITRLAPVAMESMLRTATSTTYGSGPEVRSPWMVECGVVTSLTVGIFGTISPFGVLSVHLDEAREFSDDEFRFLELAATVISVAVERRRSEEQRRLLLGRLVTAQEAERRSIAGDIHDDAVQVMTAANMRLELFRRLLVDPVQLDALEKLQQTVSLATARLRNLLFELNPPDLERHGLAVALRRHLEQFQEATSVPWTLHDDLLEEPSAEPRILLFRIFQEALANIRKHAAPRAVTASLRTVDGGVMMTVADDGAGFVVSAGPGEPGHLGLASMRERAEIAGGWWRLSSDPGKGTEVQTWVPLEREPGSPVTPIPAVLAVA